MQQETIKISKLKSNSGQIEGLPKNPRKISSQAKDTLRKSIVESPEMLEFKSLVVYPLGENYVVIIGNQRLAICKDMKFKELPCFILPAETSIEKLKEYSIKDNVNSGSWDWAEICMRRLHSKNMKGEKHFNFKIGLATNREFTCAFCNSKFFSKKGYSNRTPKYCNKECTSKASIKDEKIKNCLECKKTFKQKTFKNNIFCSKGCVGAYKSKQMTGVPNGRSGNKSNLWRGGISSENDIIRKGKEYKTWRINVFKRDNFKCQHCGQIGGNLQADHIKQFAIYPELRFDIDNGRTLCEECHKKTDTYGGKGYKKSEDYKNKHLRLSIEIKNKNDFDYIVKLTSEMNAKIITKKHTVYR